MNAVGGYQKKRDIPEGFKFIANTKYIAEAKKANADVKRDTVKTRTDNQFMQSVRQSD